MLVKSDCTQAEIKLLYDIGYKSAGKGIICDVGCGTGGSTIAFAMGLKAAARPPEKQIKAFDLFDLASVPHATLERFHTRTREYEDYIEAFPGDITTVRIPTDPIEILFIDIAKTRAAHKSSVGRFYNLLTLEAVVLNQDFGRPNLPWIQYAFVYLSDHADRAEIVDDTIVLTGSGKIGSDTFARVANDDFTDVEREALIRRGIEKYGDQPARAGVLYKDILTLSLAFLKADSPEGKQHYERFMQAVPTPTKNLVKVVESARKLIF